MKKLMLSVALCLFLTSQALASLVFGAATSDRVVAATGASDLTAFTVMVWHYPTSRTNGRRWFEIAGPSYAKTCFWGFTDDGPEVEIPRAGGSALAASSTTYTLDQWTFSVITYDETDGVRIFSGTLSAALTEDAYVTRTVGSGATNTGDNTGWTVGNDTTFSTAYQGRIAFFAILDTRLTSTQAEEFRRFPYKIQTHANKRLGYYLGLASAGTQRDVTGNGLNGTVTGATVGEHVPLWFPGREVLK